MKLSILISTIDEGIDKVKKILLVERPDVEYVISHQYTEKKFKFIPLELRRNDIIISQISGKGLSKSRNNAIRNATGDIALISDDDVRYKNEYVDKIIKTYKNNDVDVACFKIKTSEGERSYKLYPTGAIEIKDFSLYSPSSIELTFALNAIRTQKIKFDERFGLGAKFIGGEEKIFLKDCIEQNLNTMFYPEYIVAHSYESSNKTLSAFNGKIVKKNAAVDCRLNGAVATIKAILGPIKHLPKLLRNRINPFYYFYCRVSSVGYILLTNRKYIKN